MLLQASMQRRQALSTIAATVAALGAPAARANAKRVRLILGIPTMSPLVANQTSVPTALGYYEQEGLAVEPVLAGAGGTSGAFQLVASGDQDIGSASYSPLLSRVAEGKDLGVSYFYLQLRAYALGISVPADSTVTSISQMKGKVLGISTLGSESAKVAEFLARMSSMNPATDLQMIAVGTGAQAAQALRSKQIDAYMGPNSQIAQIETLGLKLRSLQIPERLRDLVGPGLFARRDYIEKNRAAVVGVGRAVAKGTLFLMSNPEAAIRLHWKAFPQQLPQSMSAEQAMENAMRTIKVQIEGLKFQADEPKARFGEFMPQALEALSDVYGLAGRVPTAAQLFSNDLIAEINAFDRDKIIQQAKNFKV
jgi:NitT/TauT family transport system substrate-binding protein